MSWAWTLHTIENQNCRLQTAEIKNAARNYTGWEGTEGAGQGVAANPMSTQAGQIHSIRREGSAVFELSIEERMSAGKALREKIFRNSHSEWTVPLDRPDPIAVLRESDRGRLSELLPVRTAGYSNHLLRFSEVQQ
ncbi:MAG: hypothetical protein WAL52_04310 [Candidatus Sulfotelmatobacter sp.]